MTRLVLVIAAAVLLVAACTSDRSPENPEATPIPEVTPTPTAVAPVLTPAVESLATETPRSTMVASDSLEIRYQTAGTRTGVTVVDETLAEIEAGDAEALVARVRLASAPCLHLVLYLFECSSEMPEGTLVERFNASSCNIVGIHSLEHAQARVRQAIPTPMRIHSVTTLEADVDQPASYWIYFGILTEDDQTAATTFWIAADGGIVGVHHCGFTSVDGNWTFLLPPVE